MNISTRPAATKNASARYKLLQWFSLQNVVKVYNVASNNVCHAFQEKNRPKKASISFFIGLPEYDIYIPSWHVKPLGLDE